MKRVSRTDMDKVRRAIKPKWQKVHVLLPNDDGTYFNLTENRPARPEETEDVLQLRWPDDETDK